MREIGLIHTFHVLANSENDGKGINKKYKERNKLSYQTTKN